MASCRRLGVCGAGAREEVRFCAEGPLGGARIGNETVSQTGAGMMAPDGIGVLLRGIREAAERSRGEQALLLQKLQGGQWFDPENLKRWETERRMPILRWHGLLADGYGLTQKQIIAAVSASRRWRRLRRAADDGAKGGEQVDRWRFLAAAAAVTGAAPLSGMADARRGIDAGLSGSDVGDLAYVVPIHTQTGRRKDWSACGLNHYSARSMARLISGWRSCWQADGPWTNEFTERVTRIWCP
ncbi:hypothetical protein P3T35_001715 [Kitasatospora sp. GP30]|nr:hypothetical protein [Kitasatospora sp. GP30]